MSLGLTVTLQAAVLPPSMVVMVIVAVPIFFAITTPPSDTVAIFSSLLLHVTFLIVALSGSIAGMRVSEPPTARLVDSFKDTPVTATSTSLRETVTLQDAVLPPSSVVTVIVAEPASFAVTTPSSTVAIFSSLLLHVTLWFVASEGVIAGMRVSVSSLKSLADVLSSDMPVTAMVPGSLSWGHAVSIKRTARSTGIIPVFFIRNSFVDSTII